MKTPWRPSMAEYHQAEGISASFLSSVFEHGLSGALMRRRSERQCRKAPHLLIGSYVHAVLQSVVIPIAPAPVWMENRKSRDYKEFEKQALRAGFEGMLLHAEIQAANALCNRLQLGSSPAQRQIRGLLFEKNFKRWPEVSHRWQPPEVEITCKVRPDMLIQMGDRVVQVCIKTHGGCLRPEPWWNFWANYPHPDRRPGWHLTSAAFHWAGMLDLFGQEIPQLWVVGRTEHPYPWALHEISTASSAGRGYLWADKSAQELLEETWHGKIIPELQDIADGREWGREERGLE